VATRGISHDQLVHFLKFQLSEVATFLAEKVTEKVTEKVAGKLRKKISLILNARFIRKYNFNDKIIYEA
jgi:hypothetical protein